MPPAELEVAIPFEGHNSDKQRIINVQERASIAHVVSSETSHTRAFIARNEYMVDNSDIVIAFLDDANEARDTEKSGTLNAISYAKEQQKTIILFSPSWFESDWPSISRIRVLQPIS